MKNFPHASAFKWTPARRAAAAALADGKTQKEAAEVAEVTDRTIRLWLAEPDFSEEVDQLTLITGIAVRAERIRIAKRVINRLDDKTEKDLLEWLKFVQSETDGSRSDIADKLAALLAAQL